MDLFLTGVNNDPPVIKACDTVHPTELKGPPIVFCIVGILGSRAGCTAGLLKVSREHDCTILVGERAMPFAALSSLRFLHRSILRAGMAFRLYIFAVGLWWETMHDNRSLYVSSEE